VASKRAGRPALIRAAEITVLKANQKKLREQRGLLEAQAA